MLQKLIDLLRGKKILTIKLQDNVFYTANYKNKYNGCYIYNLKYQGMENNLSEIETLILGSSHGVYGYLPNKKEFNLCFPSQDLYYALKLYEIYRKKCPNLSKIYLFYSIFTPGFELSETSEKWRCVWYKKFFDIKSPNAKVNILSDKLIKKLRNKIHKICSETVISDDYRGENIDLDGVCTFKNHSNYTAKQRALDHFKSNIRSTNSNKYLIKLINLIKKDKRELCIILAPMHEEFRKYLTRFDVLFEELYKIATDENIKILNYYDNPFFKNSDFFDFDHLNLTGSNKLTNLIHKQELKKNKRIYKIEPAYYP